VAVDQTGIEPVALALAWLQQHPRVTAAWGGADHVSGLVEAPWPHLRVMAGPGGSLRRGIWTRDQEVRLEGITDPAGTTGEYAISQLVLVAVGALLELADQPTAPGDPVISFARPIGTVGRDSSTGFGGIAGQQLTSGQVRYSASVMLTGHPAS
jgi:hypothetical protein